MNLIGFTAGQGHCDGPLVMGHNMLLYATAKINHVLTTDFRAN